MQPFFEPIRMYPELIYTFLVSILCFLIYYKTKDLYSLTKHQGIKYFRYTFLFFGLAYLTRFLLFLFMISPLSFNNCGLPRKMFGLLFIIILGYFSTIAIMNLSYSIIWKKIPKKGLFLFANIFAIFISYISFKTRSFEIILYIQLLLFIIALFIIIFLNYKNKKVNNFFFIYILLFLFWTISLFTITKRPIVPFELKIILYIISVGIFSIIYYKVKKWTK
jgi:hypothetical protein